MFVDGDHPALCSTLFAGLFDADVSDIREITQVLQLLIRYTDQTDKITFIISSDLSKTGPKKVNAEKLVQVSNLI